MVESSRVENSIAHGYKNTFKPKYAVQKYLGLH